MRTYISCVGPMVLCLGTAVLIGYGQNRNEKPGEILESPPLQAADQPSGDRPQPAEIQVRIDNFTFRPARLTVAPGTRVTWTNNDDVPHTVTADGKAFKSGTLDTNDKFSFVFDKPGTYSYFCAVHRHMTGTVVVQPAGK